MFKKWNVRKKFEKLRGNESQKEQEGRKTTGFTNKETDSTSTKLEATLKVFAEKTWKQYKFEKRVFVLSTLIYGVVLLMLVSWVLTRKPTVILVPPEIREKLSISFSTAGEPYYKEMALFLSELVGNLSPGNAKYAVEVFSRYLDPSIYEKVRDSLEEIADMIETKQTATAFYPTQIGHIGDTWYVVGLLKKLGSTKEHNNVSINEQEVTYEMRFKVRNFRLYVVYFKQQPGNTLRKAERQAKRGQ